VIVIGLLASVHPALILLAVFAIPTVMASSSRPMVERRVRESVDVHDRQAKHLFQIATTAAPGKEVRVAQIGPQLSVDRRAAWDEWYAPMAAVRWTSAWVTAVSWAFFGLAYVGAIVFVAAGIDEKAGAVLLVVAAGGRLSAYVGAAVGELGFLRSFWLDAGRKLCWLEDYAEALASHGDLDVPKALATGISFEHVSFAYPGTDRLVLDDATLTLPAGAVVAIVGENGAGKTTLVKLLAQMYAPTSGAIMVDGQDLARFAHEQWRHELAGAFQDFFRFEFQAITSVGLGDLAHLDDRPVIEAAVDRSGAHDLIDALDHGLDTQLGAAWEGGAELSHGQWQKLALARGFMRADPLVLVLDEPTSALDAETEHALFERYATAARGGAAANGRVTLLVSHRFSTVRMADLIVVLDGARVAEVGSHEQLMANGGLYSELYTIQAQAYQ
jgi:ATP-binding cassette, subfamily B, bacterial